MDLTLKHGSEKHVVSLSSDARLPELASAASAATGVPVARVKLIHKGKTLNHTIETEATLKSRNVNDQDKILVLGKKYDPLSDQAYQSVLATASSIEAISNRLAEVQDELEETTQGFLEPKLLGEKQKQLQRTCKSGQEEFLKLLEKLDAISVEAPEARAKRKSVVDDINAKLEASDDLLLKIEQLTNQESGEEASK